jgi:phosphomannomutase
MATTHSAVLALIYWHNLPSAAIIPAPAANRLAGRVGVGPHGGGEVKQRLCAQGATLMSLMVSISGIRGIVGKTMTPHLAASAGCAFATFNHGGRVVVGRDSRPSGEMVKSALISGLLAGGCEVIDLGVVTTPSTAIMVRELSAAGGVVLTASHNPSQWNGIKFLTREGTAPPKAVAEKILEVFRSDEFELAPVERIGKFVTDDTTHHRHVDLVLKIVDVDAIKRHEFRVVLDSVNGAGGPAGRMLLEALGCDIVHINAEPTGFFAHTPEPIMENLTELCERTRSEDAAVGFAQDPDADRLAMVDENGRFFGEEYTLAIAARHVFATRPGPAAANLSTSRMIDVLAEQAGGDCVVHRSAVGEANVVEMMKSQGCVIGGEGNGGVIDPRVVYVRDSLTAMAMTLQVMAEDARPLSEIVDSLPRFVMLKQKFECDTPRIAKALEAVRKAFALEKLSTIDGVRIDWESGWVHVRGSNTEPIMRVIGEAEDERTARALIDRVRKVVDSAR